jgi:hypothetical protein
VGNAFTSEIRLLSAAPEGSVLICDNRELTRPVGSAVAPGKTFDGTRPDATTFDGSALIWDSSELSATALVGSTLTSEIKELSPPGTAPLGRALTCDSKELTNPDGTGAFVGTARISETKLLIPETPAAPLDIALT